MRYLPRIAAAPTAVWPDLVAELDEWREVGCVAALWWRDDDAADATAELTNLLRLAGATPLALAVIPAAAGPGLAAALRVGAAVSVLQHGWRHANHAAHGRKSEYPAERPPAAVAAEVTAGRTRLVSLFGERALPVFVPPWNRFAAGLLPVLAANGIAAVSAMASSRSSMPLPEGLVGFDVHVDLVDWRGDRGFIGTSAALGGLLGRLRAQRLGVAPATVPIGILTHHLVMDGATAAFLNRLLALVGTHAAARWADIAEWLR
jgi:hypothetical protein